MADQRNLTSWGAACAGENSRVIALRAHASKMDTPTYRACVLGPSCARRRWLSALLMANRKRQLDQGSSGSEAKKDKRQVTLATFHKWQKQYEREHRTLSWLRCDVDSRDKSLVQILWCDACRNHEKRLTGLRNFSRVWITGSNNHKTSNIIDHAKSEQHHAAMIQAAKASHQPITSYSPLARSFTTMEATAEERVRRKFDINFVMCLLRKA